MKKLVLQVPLSHKHECFEPERCIVEKTVVLPHRFFEAMRLHPMDDSPYIAENRKFMWNDEHGAHCVLFLDSEGDDGILVQSEGYSYARRAQFVPGAKQLAFDAAFTTAEHRIHNALADMAEEAVKRMHRGEESFNFKELAEETDAFDFDEALCRALTEHLQSRADIEAAEYVPLQMDFQPDVRLTPKPLYTMRLITSLQIETVPDEDEDESYSIDPREATACRDEINRFMQDYTDENERDRGLMVYYSHSSSVSEKVWSAFPSVEVVDGRLMGVLTCRFSEPLNEGEAEEFRSWWRGQRSDGYGEGLEQHPIRTAEFGDIYVSLWDGMDDCRMELNAADFGEEAPEIGGISF